MEQSTVAAKPKTERQQAGTVKAGNRMKLETEQELTRGAPECELPRERSFCLKFLLRSFTTPPTGPMHSEAKILSRAACRNI